MSILATILLRFSRDTETNALEFIESLEELSTTHTVIYTAG